MKRVLIVPVNYQSYKELKLFIDSCEESFKDLDDKSMHVTVTVADNSSQQQSFIFPKGSPIYYNLVVNGNLGYLGGALRIINNTIGIEDYDYVVISNVDLELDKSFFNVLSKTDFSPSIGWVAPAILSEKEHRDKNPKILKRYTLKQLHIFQMMYKYRYLHLLYSATFYKRKKLRPAFPSREIYAGHGSLMIFTGRALSKLLPLHYPNFLFGEECFLAEKLRSVGYKVLYEPSLIVHDKEHTSTGALKAKSYYRYNFEAVNFLISEFYE